ncbi:MAG: tyrosine-type recombinase/integrase [Acetobacteraceae bacterium]|nr:tyrosine-type recombinase/integrase [Acetobacteraceae bacterium]
MARGGSAKQKPKVHARRHLRPEEARRLIEAAGKRGRYPFRDKVLVRAVYRHGLRAAEAVALRWDQFDLDNGTLEMRRAKNGKGGTHTLDRDELRDFRKLRQQAGNSLYVFETERGGPLSTDTLAYIVREAGNLARLDVDVHPHMLRHAAGYALINDGHDVRVVQDFLGHKNIASTAIYTALSPKRLAAVRVR